MTMYAPLVGVLWRTLESRGYDPCKLISRKFYNPENESVYNDRVSWDAFVAIEKDAYELIGDPALGLQTATHIHPSHLGALGHAWLASSSLRTALKRTQRFNRMLDEQVVSQISENGELLRVTHELRKEHPCPEFAADGSLSCLLALCRLNLGEELLPVEVTMKRPEPANPQPWHDQFGIQVQFGQPTNSIAFSVFDVDRKLTTSNRELVGSHEDLVWRHLAHMDRTNIKNRVRFAIVQEMPSGTVTEGHIATWLGMSKRTLHRRLRKESVTFRSLLQEVRRELASRYLRDRKYSITEIAFMLGYADTSAFSRAFRNWFKMSPTKFRCMAVEQTS